MIKMVHVVCWNQATGHREVVHEEESAGPLADAAEHVAAQDWCDRNAARDSETDHVYYVE